MCYIIYIHLHIKFSPEFLQIYGIENVNEAIAILLCYGTITII